MPCDELLVHAYFDQELEAEQRASMERHLLECHECRQVLDRLHWLQKTLGPTPLQSGLEIAGPSAIQFRAGKSHQRSRWYQARSWGMALAASLAMLLGGTRLWKADSPLGPSAQPGVYSVELPSSRYEVSVQGCQLLEVEIRDDQHSVRLNGLSKQSQ